MKLGETLRLLRQYHDMSQVTLAKSVGMSISAISMIESGKRNVTLELLDCYGRLFNLPSSFILALHEGIVLDMQGGEEATERVLRIGDWIKERITEADAQRKHAKRTNFGYLYGVDPNQGGNESDH